MVWLHWLYLKPSLSMNIHGLHEYVCVSGLQEKNYKERRHVHISKIYWWQLINIQSLSPCWWDGEVWSSKGVGRTEALWRSHIEAFSTATCSLDVGIVEDKFTGQLCLYEVHLSSQKGQLSLLLYKHPHTCNRSHSTFVKSNTQNPLNLQKYIYQFFKFKCEKSQQQHTRSMQSPQFQDKAHQFIIRPNVHIVTIWYSVP